MSDCSLVGPSSTIRISYTNSALSIGLHHGPYLSECSNNHTRYILLFSFLLMMKLKFGELNNLPKVTQPVNRVRTVQLRLSGATV